MKREAKAQWSDQVCWIGNSVALENLNKLPILLMMAELKGISFNVRGIKSKTRRIALFNFLTCFTASVLFLQECNIPHEISYKKYKDEWKCGPSVWSGSNATGSAGVAILFKGNVLIDFIQEILPGRILLVKAFINGIKWQFLNFYGSPEKNERAEMLDLLPLFINNSEPFILAGDFNCIFKGENRRSSSVSRNYDKTSGVLFTEKNDGYNSWEAITQKVNTKICMWNMRKLTMEGKVLILKMVILPLLLYLSMVFPPPVNVLKKITKTCFTFFWNSKMEKLKREIVMKAKPKGGKDFPDFNRFLLIHFFVYCFNAFFKTHYWSFFMRFNTGFFMRNLGWYKVNLSAPYAFNLPAHYMILRKIVSDFNLGNKKIEELKDSKKLIKEIRKNEEICNIERYDDEESTSIWKMINGFNLFNIQRDLAWSCAHSCLPCRAFQYRRGFVRSAICPRVGCQDEETVEHLLWSCKFAKDLWRRLLPLLERVADLKDFNYKTVLYGLMECPTMDQQIMAWKTVNCAKSALWKARNIAVFNQDVFSVDNVLELCLCDMYTYYLMDKKQNVHVSKKWLVDQWNLII
ncbi:uncharacterized protein [Dendrobates tinctorius]|uniref:uncharacterized protein n=1 Tax=Dendrobates tinctorius TaxID=92724 RepID=UPI003CC95554